MAWMSICGQGPETSKQIMWMIKQCKAKEGWEILSLVLLELINLKIEYILQTFSGEISSN